MSVLSCISSEQFYVHWSLGPVSLFFPPLYHPSFGSILEYLSSAIWDTVHTKSQTLCLGIRPGGICLLFFFLLEFSLALNFVACDPPQVGNISSSWDSLLHCNYRFLYFVHNWGFSFIQGKSILSHLRGCSSCFFSYWKACTHLWSEAHTATNV